MLDFYGRRSQIFMAARFDAARAAELGQAAGDGTPIMLTIPTDQPWVPLRILSLGLEGASSSRPTCSCSPTSEPSLLAGGPGLTLARSEPADDLLLDDLRSDVGMEWVPDDMWFTYLQVGTEAGDARLRPRHLRRPDHARRRITDTGVEVSEAQPVLAPGAGRSRCGRWPPAGSSA